jgi:hypothetical protein
MTKLREVTNSRELKQGACYYSEINSYLLIFGCSFFAARYEDSFRFSPRLRPFSFQELKPDHRGHSVHGNESVSVTENGSCIG